MGERKIRNLVSLAKDVADLRRRGKKIVQCHGVFDLVHPGHIRHFAAAKKEGDILLVTLTADKFVRKGPGRPLFNERLRAEALAALEVVDYVTIVSEPTAVESIRLLKSDVYVKGQDYRRAKDDVTGKIIDEERAVKAHGGKIVFTEDVVFSSSELINNQLDVFPRKTRQYLKSIERKYGYEEIVAVLKDIEKLNVLVMGDAVIDQYDYCAQLGKSGKEPLIVNKYLEGESFAGGALATANHISSVCGKVELVTMLGRTDSWREFIIEHLTSKIRPKFFYRPGAGTTVKRRYVSNNRNQKLFELYFMDDEPINREIENLIIEYLRKCARNYDVVVVNDFGHGFITDRIIRTISRQARKLALNVQTNGANAGFNLVTKYPRADFVCVDEVELRYATHDRVSNLKKVARQVQQETDADLVVTTRGAEGSLTLSRKDGFVQTPAFASHVVDPVGAGDAFFAFAAPAYAAGLPTELIPFIGNVAGSLATQIVGNRDVVQLPDVLKFVARLLK